MKVLTGEEIREGLAAAKACRRFTIWNGIKLAGFMAGVGFFFLVAVYRTQGQVSPWSFIFPVILAALVLPPTILEVRHFSKMIGEFYEAEEHAASGGTVHARDVPSLFRRPAA